MIDSNHYGNIDNIMAERIVIVAYKPKSGKYDELQKLVEEHYSILKEEGLVSNRKPIIVRSSNNEIVEIFGWKSPNAIAQAHENTIVQDLWKKFADICEYIPVANIRESKNLFSEFNPLN